MVNNKEVDIETKDIQAERNCLRNILKRPTLNLTVVFSLRNGNKRNPTHQTN